MNRSLNPLLFFLICAIIDFVWGSIEWHSVGAGVGAIVGGLPLTAILYFFFRWARKSNDDSDVPRA